MSASELLRAFLADVRQHVSHAEELQREHIAAALRRADARAGRIDSSVEAQRRKLRHCLMLRELLGARALPAEWQGQDAAWQVLREWAKGESGRLDCEMFGRLVT